MATQNSFCPMPVGSCSYLLIQLNVWDVFSERYFPASFYWTIYNTLSRGNKPNPYTFITITSNCDMRKEVIRISYNGILPPSDLNNGILPLIYERGFGGGAHTWRAYDNIFGGSEQVMFPRGDGSIIPSPGCDAGMNDCITDGGIDGFPHVKAVSVPADQPAAWIQNDCANVTLNVPRGADGQAATIKISETVTLPAGSAAAFVEAPNSTPQDRIYKAEIPGNAESDWNAVATDNSGDVQFSGDGNKTGLKGTVPALANKLEKITVAPGNELGGEGTPDNPLALNEVFLYSQGGNSLLSDNSIGKIDGKIVRLAAQNGTVDLLGTVDNSDVADAVNSSDTDNIIIKDAKGLLKVSAGDIPSGTEDDVARAAAQKAQAAADAAQTTADGNTAVLKNKMNLAGDNANIPMDAGTNKWGALVGATSSGLKSVPFKNIISNDSGNLLKPGSAGGMEVLATDIPSDSTKLNADGSNPNLSNLPSGLANYGIPVYNQNGKLSKSNIDQIFFSAKLTQSISALFASSTPGLQTGTDGGMSVNVDGISVVFDNLGRLSAPNTGGGGLQKVAHDQTLQNDGTDTSKLGLNWIANQQVTGIVGCNPANLSAPVQVHWLNDLLDNNSWTGTFQGISTDTIYRNFTVPFDSTQFKMGKVGGHDAIQLMNGGGGGGGLSKVAHDTTLKGDGTSTSQLGVQVSGLSDNQLQSIPSGLYVASPAIIGFGISSN